MYVLQDRKLISYRRACEMQSNMHWSIMIENDEVKSTIVSNQVCLETTQHVIVCGNGRTLLFLVQHAVTRRILLAQGRT